MGSDPNTTEELTPQKKRLKRIIFIVGTIPLAIGVYLMIITDLREHYSLLDVFAIRERMQIIGIICAILYGILIAILSVLRSIENKKVHWFLGTVLLYTLLTSSIFTDMSRDIYGYINMQSKERYIVVNTSNILARVIPDEVGHDRYYIISVSVDKEAFRGYFSKLKYEISQERYFKIKREEDTARIKLYEGKFGYYHSPEIYRE